ncbi:hypothetical protein ABH922_004682 [Rhodococcus sp. 27YEA15]|uniref:hypothetical protein n=1 Tax=Rhodococcus sp. 27YEA15 TaxID=3156259 RepID=UPI003C7CB57C
MRGPTRLLLALVPLGLVVGLGACSDDWFRGDTESFRPPDATVVDHADCFGPNTRSQLVEIGRNADVRVVEDDQSGYPPDSFDPVTVVRCELGRDAAQKPTIDTVTLDGDVGAVRDAFRVQSRRFRDGVFASCAIHEIVPAALWLVDTTGRAVELAWPARPCGYQDGPVQPLRNLREVDRTSESTVVADANTACDRQFFDQFERTDAAQVDDVRGRLERGEMYNPLDNELATPITDVGGLVICRSSESGSVSGIRLTQKDSRELMVAISQASYAPPCDLAATAIAQTTLLRADGSGGTDVFVELDGCRRALLNGYLSTPDWAIETMSR